MITCKRCGVETPLLTRDQTRCPKCEREVRELIRSDRERRLPRFRAKDLTETLS